MSNQSDYSEGFLTGDIPVVPGSQQIGNLPKIDNFIDQISENLKNELKNELETYKREITRKVRFLQVELSDAKFEIADLKTKNEELEKRVDELENKTETQDPKIDHLEKTIDEKILENEMMIENNERMHQVAKPPRSAQNINLNTASEMVAQKNFGLNELRILSEYG